MLIICLVGFVECHFLKWSRIHCGKWKRGKCKIQKHVSHNSIERPLQHNSSMIKYLVLQTCLLWFTRLELQRLHSFKAKLDQFWNNKSNMSASHNELNRPALHATPENLWGELECWLHPRFHHLTSVSLFSNACDWMDKPAKPHSKI